MVLIGLVAPLVGCSNNRAWGTGTAGGLLVGTGAGVAIALAVDPADGTERTGVVIGSAVGGAILGALIGHYVFDAPKNPSEQASIAPPPDAKTP